MIIDSSKESSETFGAHQKQGGASFCQALVAKYTKKKIAGASCHTRRTLLTGKMAALIYIVIT